MPMLARMVEVCRHVIAGAACSARAARRPGDGRTCSRAHGSRRRGLTAGAPPPRAGAFFTGGYDGVVVRAALRRRSAALSRLDATWRYVIASPAAGGALHLARSRRACGDSCMLLAWLTLAVAQAQPRFGSSAWIVPGSPTHAAAGGTPSGPPVTSQRCACGSRLGTPVTSGPQLPPRC